MPSARQGGRTRRLRRSWPQRLLIGANVALIAACLVVASGLGYFYNKYTQIERVAVGQQLSEESEAPGDPENWLLVGSDTRAGIDLSGTDAAAIGSPDEITGQRSDSMMVLRLDPAEGQARLLSIPRDLLVPLAGSGREVKINSAYAEGPDRLIRTIQEYLDIPIHHYVEIDFQAFKNVVDAVGGVPVAFEARVRDRHTGLDVVADEFPACVMLDGTSALAFARSRHYEALVDGDWVGDPSADIGRMQRQQDFIRRALQRAVARGARDLGVANRLIDVVVDDDSGLKLDDRISIGDLQRLAREFSSFDPARLETASLPTVGTYRGGAAVELMAEEQAEPLLERFRDPVEGAPAEGLTPPDLSLLDPSEVEVAVLNGSGVSGAAREASEALAERGFEVTSVGDADRSTYTTDVVRHPVGQEAEASLLAAYLDPGARIEPAEDGADGLVLVLGRSHEGVRAALGEAPAPPPTTGTGDEDPDDAGDADATTTTAPPVTIAPEFLPATGIPCG